MNVRAATEFGIAEMHRVRLAARENRLGDPERIRLEDYGEMLASGAQRVWLTTAPNSRAERFCRRARRQHAGAEPSGEARYEITAEMRGLAAPGDVDDPARRS
jgi:hypothetical protein